LKYLLTILFTGLIHTSIEADYYDSGKLTEQLGAQLIKPFLAAVNSGDRNKIATFSKNNFSAKMLEEYSMDELIGYMLEYKTKNGLMTFHSLRTYDGPRPKNQSTFIFKAKRTESWGAVIFTMDNDNPQKIDNFDVYPANIPKDLPELSPLTLDAAIQELDGFVKRMSDNDVFSGSVLLSKDDKVLYKAAHGMASKRFSVANNVQTKFNLGSMNKMFTSIAILQLIAADKLNLTDKLEQFIDESWLTKEIAQKIEIQHLLTHSSGLGSFFSRKYRQSSNNIYLALDDFKPLIKNETLAFEPGTDNRYSNTGMFMLGVVIEKVTGQDYYSYIREHIYKPAGMKSSDSFEMDQPVPNLAIGYEANSHNQTGWSNNLYRRVIKGTPAGGGYSTVGDLQRFAKALTQFKLLDKKYTEMLYSAKPEFHSDDYGYGFIISGTPANRIVGHGGGFVGISSNMDIYLDQGYVASVLSNYGRGSGSITDKIRELLSRIE